MDSQPPQPRQPQRPFAPLPTLSAPRAIASRLRGRQFVAYLALCLALALGGVAVGRATAGWPPATGASVGSPALTGQILQLSPTATILIPPSAAPSGGSGWQTVLTWSFDQTNTSNTGQTTGRFLIPSGAQPARVIWRCQATSDIGGEEQAQCVANLYRYQGTQRVFFTALVNQYGDAQGTFTLPTTPDAMVYVIVTDMAHESASIQVQLEY